MCAVNGGGGREREGGEGRIYGGEWEVKKREKGEREGEREKEREGGGGERREGRINLLFFSPPGVTLTLLTLTTRLRPGGCLRECFRHFKM